MVENMPVAVGSYVQYDRKLDGRIAQGVVSINAFKGVSFGEGFKAAEKPGSEIQDEILYDNEIGFYRGSNHLGGFEGGMTNGMPIIVNGVMKPILLYINHLIPLILILKKTLKPRLNVLTVVQCLQQVLFVNMLLLLKLLKPLQKSFNPIISIS